MNLQWKWIWSSLPIFSHPHGQKALSVSITVRNKWASSACSFYRGVLTCDGIKACRCAGSWIVSSMHFVKMFWNNKMWQHTNSYPCRFVSLLDKVLLIIYMLGRTNTEHVFQQDVCCDLCTFNANISSVVFAMIQSVSCKDPCLSIHPQAFSVHWRLQVYWHQNEDWDLNPIKYLGSNVRRFKYSIPYIHK